MSINEFDELVEFSEWINSIEDTEEFKELDIFLHISDFRGQTLLDKLMYYLGEGYSHKFSYSQSKQRFYEFFEAYKKKESKIYLDENGYIDLSKTIYLTQPFSYTLNPGFFTAGWYIFSDGSKYLSKIPLNYKSYASEVDDENCVYNPVIATGIAKELGIDTSENYIGIERKGKLRVLSKNFLKPNEELINFFDFSANYKISKILKSLETSLMLRKFPKDQIEKAKFDFLKQEFLAKVIGLSDQTEDNTNLIISIDDDGTKSVRLAPMYDFDFSFHMMEANQFRVREADNGEIDIVSFIEQYKAYSGFLDFVKNSVNKLNMENVYENIYKNTGLEFFKNHRDNPVLTDEYTPFVNQNLESVKKFLRVYEKRKVELMKLYDYE